MKILLNTIPVRKGGGLTATRAMLKAVEISDVAQEHEFLVATRTELATGLQQTRLNDNRPIAELQLGNVQRSFQPDWCVSTFGPVPLIRRRATRYFANCAYSNLFYPEIDFWSQLSRKQRLKQRAIDWYRLRQSLAADITAFETTDLEDRATRQHPRAGTKFICLPPAKDEDLIEALASLAPSSPSTSFRVLLFSGPHPNKNWHLLPAIAAHLRAASLRTTFVLTTPETPAIRSLISATVLAGGDFVDVSAVGTIDAPDRPALLRSVDSLLLMSNLESYSNNVYESWSAEIPLIITDSDWARSPVGDAGFYANIAEPSHIAAAIIQAATVPDERGQKVAAGLKSLQRMPNHDERLGLLLSELRSLSSSAR